MLGMGVESAGVVFLGKSTCLSYGRELTHVILVASVTLRTLRVEAKPQGLSTSGPLCVSQLLLL